MSNVTMVSFMDAYTTNLPSEESNEYKFAMSIIGNVRSVASPPLLILAGFQAPTLTSPPSRTAATSSSPTRSAQSSSTTCWTSSEASKCRTESFWSAFFWFSSSTSPSADAVPLWSRRTRTESKTFSAASEPTTPPWFKRWRWRWWTLCSSRFQLTSSARKWRIL